MSTKHTPTPWNTVSDSVMGTLIRQEGLILAKMRKLEGIDHEANAQRIVDCVNAMEGIESPQKLRETWEAVKHLELDAYIKVKAERDTIFELIESVHHLFQSDKPITKDSIIGTALELAYQKFKSDETK